MNRLCEIDFSLCGKASEEGKLKKSNKDYLNEISRRFT